MKHDAWRASILSLQVYLRSATPAARFARLSPRGGHARLENMLAVCSCSKVLARSLKDIAWPVFSLKLQIYVVSTMPSARFSRKSPHQGSVRQQNMQALHSCAQILAWPLKHDAWRPSILSLQINKGSATSSARFARQSPHHRREISRA